MAAGSAAAAAAGAVDVDSLVTHCDGLPPISIGRCVVEGRAQPWAVDGMVSERARLRARLNDTCVAVSLCGRFRAVGNRMCSPVVFLSCFLVVV